jgi:hypothetical protein
MVADEVGAEGVATARGIGVYKRARRGTEHVFICVRRRALEGMLGAAP